MSVGEFIASLGLEPDEKSFERGDKLLEGIKKGIEILGVVEAARGIKEMIDSTVELGASLVDTSQKLGLGVDSLQFFGYVASKNGSSMEGFGDAVKHLSKNIDDARQTGTGPAALAFQRLGIDVNSARFKSLDLTQQTELLASKLAKMPDGITKTAIAMDTMGRSGADLIPTLNDLGKNGDELHAAFEEFGGGLNREQAQSLKEFDDKVKTAKMGLGQLKDQIIAAVVPALGGLVDGFMNWMRANKEAIQEVSKRVAEFAVQVVHAFATVGGAIANAIAWLEKHKDLAISLLAGLAVAIAAFAIDAAIEWAIAFWPLIAVAGIVAGVTLAVKKLMEWFAGGPISWSRMYDELKQGLVDVENWFLDIPDKISSAFDKAWDAIKRAAKAAFEWIVGLPVVKQLIEVYDYFTTKETPEQKKAVDQYQQSVLSFTNPAEYIRQMQANLNAPTLKGLDVAQGGGAQPSAATQQSARVNAPQINIKIDGASFVDPKQLSQTIKDHVSDAIEDSNRGAFSALTGGTR